MQVVGHLGISLSSSRLSAIPNPKNSININPPRRHRYAKYRSDSLTCSASKWADRLLADFHFFPTTTIPSDISDDHRSTSTATLLNQPPLLERLVSIPIDFYRVLGAERYFLGDSIRRAYEARISILPQSGYSQDALISRRQILQAACETLAYPASRRQYNHGLAEDEEHTISTEVPLDKVPGALCLLQEAGESAVVLEIGNNLLMEKLPKSFKQDVVLAMGLAYIDISRNAMAVSQPDFIKGCESLRRALKLLQEEGATTLAPDLQSQINETLEEITPRCILDLLALPLDGEYKNQREEGLQGARRILSSVGGGGAAAIGGRFTREGFMNEAFWHMTASEQVDIFAATPSSIPAESFEVYGVALALVAQAFVGKKPYLIKDADNLFHQLQQTKATAPRNDISFTVRENREVDFALERGLCSLLVGELDDCRTWLGLDSNASVYRDPSIVNFVMETSVDGDFDEGNKLLSGLCKLLETWLMEVIFPRFRDTKGVQFKLGDYYDDPTVLKYLERLEGVGGSPLVAAAAIVRIGSEATAALGNVKASVTHVLKRVFPGTQKAEILESERNDSMGISEIDGSQQLGFQDLGVKIIIGGVVVGLMTLVGLKCLRIRNGFIPKFEALNSSQASHAIDVEPLIGGIAEEIPKMDARYAEGLVRKWQDIKSEALGPNHCFEKLSEVLDGEMLKIWSDRASGIAHRGWFWEYELLDLSIDSVTLSSSGRRATVEATLKESATLVCPHQSDSRTTTSHSIRYDMAYSLLGWKITKGVVLRS